MPFKDPVLDGDTLTRDSIQLVDPATGKTVILIGISSDDDFPTIQFPSQDGTNKAFINSTNFSDVSAADIGINAGTYTPTDGTERRARLFLADSEDSATLEIITPADQKTLGGWVHAQSDAVFVGYRDVAGGISHFLEVGTANRISVNAPMVHQFAGSIAETWHHVGDTDEPAFSSPWANTAAGNLELMFRRDVQNNVQITGRPKTTASVSSGTTIFTLPAGYRPNNLVCCPAVFGNPASPALLIAHTDGTVTLNNFVTGSISAIDFGTFVFPLGQ